VQLPGLYQAVTIGTLTPALKAREEEKKDSKDRGKNPLHFSILSFFGSWINLGAGKR